MDGVLELRSARWGFRAFVVLEAKRAGKARSTWAFVAAPFVKGEEQRGQVILDRFNYRTDLGAEGPEESTDPIEAMAGSVFADAAPICHFGFELKLQHRKGREEAESEQHHEGERLMDKAIRQSLLGSLGLISSVEMWRNDRRPFFIVPVVITDANLMYCESRLADMVDPRGQLPADVKVREVPWVWREEHVFESQRPQVKRIHPQAAVNAAKYDRLGVMLDHEISRAVAVVNIESIPEFFNTLENRLTHWQALDC